MLKTKKIKAFLFVIVSSLFISNMSLAENQSVKTNKEIFQTIIQESLEVALKSVEQVDIFYLQKNENEILIEDTILEYLKSRNKRVIFSKNLNEAGGAGYYIEIKFDKMEINYKKTKNNLYNRDVNVDLIIKIIDNETKELKFIKNFDKSHIDLITKDMVISQLNLKDSFLKGTLMESKGLKKILEPALVIISSSIIVYLFYSIRSR